MAVTLNVCSFKSTVVVNNGAADPSDSIPSPSGFYEECLDRIAFKMLGFCAYEAVLVNPITSPKHQTSCTHRNDLDCTARIQIPVLVSISETAERGTMTETSPEFRMAPVIQELTIRVNGVT